MAQRTGACEKTTFVKERSRHIGNTDMKYGSMLDLLNIKSA